MKIGVIFNPGAGGIDSYPNIGKEIEHLFSRHELFVGCSDFGSQYVFGTELGLPKHENNFNQNMEDNLSDFLKNSVEILVCVGGDGFLTHTAGFLLSRDCHIPLLGIAGGTANIGPLIKFNKQNLKNFTPDPLIIEKVGCIEVSTAGNILGYAFCDVILGDTFLGTVENRMSNLSSKAFLETGDKVEIEPCEHIIGEKFSLYINNEKKKLKSIQIAQIIISPLYYSEFYRGKAITGALCFSSYEDSGAAIGISDSIVVSKDFPDADSILMEHFLFDKKDNIRIEGIKKGISVIIDGNVYEIKDQSIKLRFIEDGARSITPGAYNGLPIKN